MIYTFPYCFAGQVDMTFTSNKGPYPVNSTINLECTVNGTRPEPQYEDFNITIMNQSETFHRQKIDSPTQHTFKMKVTAKVKVTMAYDGDVAICQTTLHQGEYMSQYITLHVYGK